MYIFVFMTLYGRLRISLRSNEVGCSLDRNANRWEGTYCKPILQTNAAAIIRQTEQQVRSWSIEHCGDEAPSNDDEMDVLLPHMMSAELPTPVHSLISLGAAMVPAAFATLHTKASNQMRFAAHIS